LEYDFHIAKAENSIKKRDFYFFFFCVFITPIMIYVFLFNIEPVAVGYRPFARFYQNIDLWTSQAFRVISCTGALIILLIEIFAYIFVFLGKTKRK
jgi:hypothetical protein